MRKLLSLLIILALVFFGSPAFAVQKSVTLAWDHDGVDLAGFKLHYGTATANYSQVIDVGMAVLCTTLNITPEKYCHEFTIDVPEAALTTFYFTATAYDAEANNSTYSEEVSDVWDFEVPPVVSDLGATYDKGTSFVTFAWSYETAWLPKVEKWVLFQSPTSGGPFVEVVDIPYDSGASPPYTTDVEIIVPEGGKVTTYYVIVAFRSAENNSAFSANSNEVSITVDKMPPKSPFEFKIKIR